MFTFIALMVNGYFLFGRHPLSLCSSTVIMSYIIILIIDIRGIFPVVYNFTPNVCTTVHAFQFNIFHRNTRI